MKAVRGGGVKRMDVSSECKCAQMRPSSHGVPTSRIANVKHGPESCLVEAVKLAQIPLRAGSLKTPIRNAWWYTKK